MKESSSVKFLYASFINTRAVLLWCCLIVTFLVLSLPVLVLILIFPYRILSPILRACGWLLCFSAGVWLDFKGSSGCQPREGVLFLCNHQSMYDPFILRAFWKRRIVGVYAEKYLRRFFIGFIFRKTGGVPIARGDHASALRTMENLKHVFRTGTSVAMMPEGTRSYDGKLLPFKSGPFHLAMQTQVKIVVVVMDKAYQAKTKGNWRLYPKRVKVRHAATISPEEYRDWSVDQLRDYVRDKMQAKLDSLNR